MSVVANVAINVDSRNAVTKLRQVRRVEINHGQVDQDISHLPTLQSYRDATKDMVYKPEPAPSKVAPKQERHAANNIFESWFTGDPEPLAKAEKQLDNAELNRGAVEVNKAAAPSGYKVRSGDTLSKIARKYKTSVGALMRLNQGNIKSANQIFVGQNINLPTAGGIGAEVNGGTVTRVGRR